MAKILRKGIAKDSSYIAYECQCKNGIDTYVRRFLIKQKNDIFVGYGYCERTPDFTITIKDIEYACFHADGKNIKIPYHPTHGEFDGLCYAINK